ncbi:hypothetical protein F5I97DRAFT_1930530 [Phlebopus sp. FC_14]|nr:hypothetical protein F5I97DRAFT_1930530 [Phlebopus sp. FC_14]
MATATDLPTRVDTPSSTHLHAHHPHTNTTTTNARASDPATRRLSSDNGGRSSPSIRSITRRTPVPFLLEAFPAPPSHIPPSPGTPASIGPASPLSATVAAAAVGSSTSSPLMSGPTSSVPTTGPAGSAASPNPPPSLPPSAPLPPIPGPSPIALSDIFLARRSLQSVRSASPALSLAESQTRSQSRAEQHPRSPTEGPAQAHASRARKGSLSSLRNRVFPSACEQDDAIQEESAEDESQSSPPNVSSRPVLEAAVTTPRDIPDILRPSMSRKPSAPLVPPLEPVEDSLASIDMSDLNALKSDHEPDPEPDEHGLHPFPQIPRLPHHELPQSPTNTFANSGPPYVHAPRKRSRSSIQTKEVFSTDGGRGVRSRSTSPEIPQIISATTPRLRKRSSSSRSRASSRTRDRKESSRSRKTSDVPPVPRLSANLGRTTVEGGRGRASSMGTRGSGEIDGIGDDAHESDSSLDLHTPLPHLMLRDGMLSPNSKLLPPHFGGIDPTRLSIASDFSTSSLLSNGSNTSLVSNGSHLSNGSNTSLTSTMSTSSKHPKDARDTPQRRTRHRDGKLLRGGIGLTTGLGWSDSEDEDAPSPLTRRLSTLVLARRASSSSVHSLRSAHSHPHPLSRSISHSVLREVDEAEVETDELGYVQHRASSSLSQSLPHKSDGTTRIESSYSTGSGSIGRSSTFSASSTPSRTRVNSGSSSYAASSSSKTNSFGSVNVRENGLAVSIPEQDDGMTPTRAAFGRSSVGADVPHTPSSTASSASLPFPATPESTEDLPRPVQVYYKDKSLPPLPGGSGSNGKYPSSLGIRSPVNGLQRERTYSNASSASTSSALGMRAHSPRGPSPAPGTPRPSITGIQRTSTAGTLRHSGTSASTPRSSLALPRPSLSTPSSAFPSTASAPTTTTNPAPTPRPFKLSPRSATLPFSPSSSSSPSSPSHTTLQPGEQHPRPGQVLTYNRNVHDKLKLRAISASTPHSGGQAHVLPTSPGGTQALLIPSSAATSSSLNSNASSMVRAANSRACSPLPSTSPTSPSQSPSPGESPRPKPRTGTGMVYKTNGMAVGGMGVNRMRLPSTTLTAPVSSSMVTTSPVAGQR